MLTEHPHSRDFPPEKKVKSFSFSNKREEHNKKTVMKNFSKDRQE